MRILYNGDMKEINIFELKNYLNPFETRENPAIILGSDEKETNGMTIGWASYGVLWKKYCATIYIHAMRYSKHIFDNAEYFSICYMKKEHKDVVKYFGTVSGKDENKIEKCGLKIVNEEAPYFEDAKIVVLCRMMGRSDFDINHIDPSIEEWYQRDGVHSQYYGEIIKVLVNEE